MGLRQLSLWNLMMKKNILLIAFFSCWVINAHASDSADLKINATVTSEACTPVMENGGVIQLGNIPVKSLKQEDKNYRIVQHKHITLDIVCSDDYNIAFRVEDNKKDTIATTLPWFNGAYGFGQTPDGKNIGLYQLYYYSVTVDGSTGRLLWKNATDTVEAPWNYVEGINSNNFIYAFSKGDVTPAAGKNFHLVMDTDYIFDKDIVNNIQDTLDFEGSATFVLVYL